MNLQHNPPPREEHLRACTFHNFVKVDQWPWPADRCDSCDYGGPENVCIRCARVCCEECRKRG